MSVSTILELPQIVESQANKATLINTVLGYTEQAIADTYVMDTSSATTFGDNLTIPFDDTSDTSDRTALRFIFLSLAAGATASFNVIHPDNKHLFYVKNDTTQTATIKTASGSGAAIGAGEYNILYCDGVNITNLLPPSSAVTSDYDLLMNFSGVPSASEVIFEFKTPREIDIPAMMAGSVGSVGVVATAATVFDLDDDGTVIGSITVTGSTVTFSTTFTVAKVIAAGSLVKVIAPVSPDATLADFTFSLLATTSVIQPL